MKKSIHDIEAEKALKARLRSRLEDLYKRRVPQSVLAGSYQYTLDYKDAMDAAKKALNNERATAQSLQQAGNALERFQ